ncbi:MAG TPA: hypothetical protein VGI19_08350 [Candidatus Cybelea sp.]
MNALAIGAKVRCHKNLQRADWSITVAGKVIANVPEIVLANVTFRYWAGGSARILADKANGRMRRRVCAWADGVIAELPRTSTKTPLTYNPYRAATFTTRARAPVERCAYVHFTHSDGTVAVGNME